MNRREHVNPYIAGAPVTGTEMFFGRQDVFSFIRRNLIGRHRDSPIVLYGQRRTGKTSVLYQLHHHLDTTYRCIFIDLHGLSLDGMGSLLYGIASSISRGLRREHRIKVQVPDRSEFLADPQSAFETGFLDEVWSLLGEDHLVLMLDEVVRIYEEVQQGRLEREIFDFLRHLMQHYERLNFIFSLGSGLEEMAKDYAFLFSVSLYHRISFLEPEAARNLIIEPAREHYRVAPRAAERILQITSGHPYYTQLICHCLFDSWARAPRPVMDVADVDAVLAEAIELGSANLTYVWEDSTPKEQVLMAGIAAAARHEPGPVTVDDVRGTWRKAGVALPEREVSRALRSLVNRDVLAGDGAYSFSVDLQRLWLDKHRRLDWVKDELADAVQHWNGSGRRITRHYAAVAAVAVLLAGYLAGAAAAGVFPFSGSAQPLPQSLVQLLQDTGLKGSRTQCHNAKLSGSWAMPGTVQGVRCTDPGLPGGNITAFQLDSTAHFRTAWQSFNTWWGFQPDSAGNTCPPSGTSQGIVAFKSNIPAQAERQLQECAIMTLDSGVTVPAYAWDFPTNHAFVIAQGASGYSFSGLYSWLTGTTPSGPRPLASLVQLLPSDIDDPATQCAAFSPPFHVSGLIRALSCTDPGLPNGRIYAFQVSSSANYETTWRDFNKWWGFDILNAGVNCPPAANGTGTVGFHNSYFPSQAGQVLECEKVGSGSNAQPAYAWTYPTQNAFIVAQGAAGWSFSALDSWWTNASGPSNSPSPSSS